ncbi:hypothetical protein B9Z44_07075 [Limnohabitans curvus]|uniref:AAA+ ATPase domain-containing protein n=1 Tax=Limnohabitans curvus TaxID=323423 RepID=A0A315EN71_9BURK|nr:AAA family ATPase [Limnohabitans curvus]PUE59350.1 hypothetical protein B9Z44_07075 [Limnohabitans curvus]
MKNDITLEMLTKLNAELESTPSKLNPALRPVAQPSSLGKNLLGVSNPETEHATARIKSALARLSSNIGRGNGSFFDQNGEPEPAYWQAVVWAIASLGWDCGKELAREWSKKAPNLYDDAGFEKAWRDYKPSHTNPVGIGSFYKFAKLHGWEPSPVDSPTAAQKRYKLLGIDDIKGLPPLLWRVKGVFPAQGLTALYGPSASGKSFLALDMAAAIARGETWFDCRTQATPVIYVALEGESGYKNRITAWERDKKTRWPANFHFVMEPFKINDAVDVDELAAQLPQGAVVFIDTLNRASPTADENSSHDMGQILEGAKRLQSAIKGLVVLVHHTGKDASKGARGHSSFFAALDGAIQVERTATGKSWSVAKAKDGEDGKKYPFRLKQHFLGQDQDGDQISSCSVERDRVLLAVQSVPKGATQRDALKQIKNMIEDSNDLGMSNSMTHVQCLQVDMAIQALAPTLVATAPNKRRHRARSLVESLINGSYLDSGLDGEVGWIWLPS